MKLRKTVAIVAASTILLAGCTTDKKEVKAYNENIQKAFDKEQSINSISKKLNSLEEKKQGLYKKLIVIMRILVRKQLMIFLRISNRDKKHSIKKYQL